MERVASFEQTVSGKTLDLSEACVEFLLKRILESYRDRVAQLKDSLGTITKVTERNELVENVAEAGHELEMLIDIVNNLKIEDSTQATRIIDQITEIFTSINRLKLPQIRRSRNCMELRARSAICSSNRGLLANQLSVFWIYVIPGKVR